MIMVLRFVDERLFIRVGWWTSDKFFPNHHSVIILFCYVISKWTFSNYGNLMFLMFLPNVPGVNQLHPPQKNPIKSHLDLKNPIRSHYLSRDVKMIVTLIRWPRHFRTLDTSRPPLRTIISPKSPNGTRPVLRWLPHANNQTNSISA